MTAVGCHVPRANSQLPGREPSRWRLIREGRVSGALITMVMFAVVLVTGNLWVLGVQTAVFACGALLGLRYSPYGLIYRWFVRPRLGPPSELEAEAPPRFAQAVGLVIGIVGIIGYASGLRPLGMVAAALGLIAAVLNGVFGLCLGCELYLIIRRTWPAQAGS